MIVTCNNCKETSEVNMYFYDTGIGKTTSVWDFHEYHEARCRGKAICPRCGKEIYEYYVRPVEPSDIIKLAIGGKE